HERNPRYLTTNGGYVDTHKPPAHGEVSNHRPDASTSSAQGTLRVSKPVLSLSKGASRMVGSGGAEFRVQRIQAFDHVVDRDQVHDAGLLDFLAPAQL